MALADEQKKKIQEALAGFSVEAGKGHYDRAMEVLNDHHDMAAKALEGGATFEAEPGFAHGLEAAGALGSDQKPLPSAKGDVDTTVEDTGQLLGVHKWELLDPGWLGSLEQWLAHLIHKAGFHARPITVDIPNNTSLALVGDWGTGRWKWRAPSSKVGRKVRKLRPDYTIHLGDVYYAGTKEQEYNNLIKVWPAGKLGSFTLNSNHEMYDGALSYFKHALRSPVFSQQQGCSYFALQNDNWLVVGLDTAYWADHFDLYMKGKLNDGQIDWLKGLPKDKRVIVLSHHQGYEATGEKEGSCYEQVIEGLGRVPDYWYWGHLHNSMVYKPMGDFHGRCIGHGAIPYGDARMLRGAEKVEWYESGLAGDRKIPMRVQNGFAHVALDGPDLKERMIGEDGSIRWQPGEGS